MRRAASAWFSAVQPSQTLRQPAPQSGGSMPAMFCGRLVSNIQVRSGVAAISCQRSARHASGARLSKISHIEPVKTRRSSPTPWPPDPSESVAASSRPMCARDRRAHPESSAYLEETRVALIAPARCFGAPPERQKDGCLSSPCLLHAFVVLSHHRRGRQFCRLRPAPPLPSIPED